VVGTRTWGGLRGVDLRYTLLDGTLVAQPKYNYWFADSAGRWRTTAWSRMSRWRPRLMTGPRATIPSSTPPYG
jgi:hypothetical protein